jgi:hypothetical protein
MLCHAITENYLLTKTFNELNKKEALVLVAYYCKVQFCVTDNSISVVCNEAAACATKLYYNVTVHTSLRNLISLKQNIFSLSHISGPVVYIFKTMAGT